MPIYKDLSTDYAKILIWKFDENEPLIMKELLEAENLEKVKDYHPQKINEILMVRKILKSVLPNHKILYKENGEPFLEPHDFNISISHSFPFAALAISENRIGIDIEKLKEKIIKIRHKFILEENDYIQDEQEVQFLTAIWCVKESLYKIHHSKHWSLKKHYDVQPFSLKNHFTVACKVYDDKQEDFYLANVMFFEDYCFSYVS